MIVGIASRSGRATFGLVYDIHHIATSILCFIGEEHHISAHDEEASTFMDHPSYFLYHPLKLGCNIFEVEGEMVGKLVVEVVVNLHMRQ